MSEYLMYLRKSRQDDPNETVEEVLNKHEIQIQENAMRTIGYHIPEKDIYREVVSGETIDDRIEIKKVFSRMEKEDIKGIYVIEPERLTRGDLVDCGTTVNMFRYTNTLICCPEKFFDMNIESDRKYIEMRLTNGNNFLEYTKMILHRGRIASKKRGNWIHTDPPYGYDKITIGKEHTLAINEAEAYYVKLMFQLFSEGLGLYKLANRLEELGAKPRKNEHFTESTLKQMLMNEVYIGKIRIGERATIKVMEDGKIVKKRIRKKDYELVDGKHEAIISEELFNKAKERFGKSSKEKGSLELQNMWAGLIKCGKCGSAMIRVAHKKDGVEYRPARIRCKGLRTCPTKSHNFHEVHDAIVEQLKIELEDFTIRVEQNSKNELNSHEELLKSLKKQLNDVNNKQTKICDFLESGLYTVEMFVERNNKLSIEKDRLEKAIKQVEVDIPSIQEMKEQLVTFHETLDMLNDDTISAKTKNIFLKKIVDVIYYTKDDNEVSLDIHLLM